MIERALEQTIGADKVDDAVEERNAELVEELARLDDGRAVGQARGVDEDVSEDLEEDVRGKGEKEAKG